MAGGPAGDIWTLEIIALLLTIIFLVIVWAKLGEIRTGKFSRITTVGVWILSLYLVLNTLGNLVFAFS